MSQALRRPRGVTASYLTRNWGLTAHRSIVRGDPRARIGPPARPPAMGQTQRRTLRPPPAGLTRTWAGWLASNKAMRRSGILVVAVAVAALASGCGSAATTLTSVSATYGAVRGTVTAGPTCPAEQAGHPCPPRPVSGAVSARRTDGREERGAANGGKRAAQGHGGTATRRHGNTAAGRQRRPPPGKRRGGGAGRGGLGQELETALWGAPYRNRHHGDARSP